jgi:two-component system alkaline phosphatase synthesis response regulator PhoP
MSIDNLNGKKILLIDDDADFFKLTCLIFKSTGAQVSMSPNGLEGIGKLFIQQPDLILLDAMIPGSDGFQICQKIREFSNTPLIMISAMDQDELMLKGLEAGADDFLSKPVNPEILLARTRAVIRRSEPNKDSHQDVLHYKDARLEIDISKHRVLVEGEHVKITPVEFRLLAYLIGNAARVLSYEQILLGVWSSDHQGKFGYVHVYISHLRNKLEANPKKPVYIRSVHRVGYIFEKQS